MRGAISGHHGSPTTSNQRFPPFECVPRGIGPRAVVGIAPSWASRRRGHRVVVGIASSWSSRRRGHRAVVGIAPSWASRRRPPSA